MRSLPISLNPREILLGAGELREEELPRPQPTGLFGFSSFAFSSRESAEIGALIRSANSGDGEAQYQIAVIYGDDERSEENARKAFFWCEKAAKSGHAKAQSLLSMYYYHEGKIETSVFWMSRAAEQGYAEAQYNLGVSYERGTGIQKDQGLAVMWLRKAADQDYDAAQARLGYYYQEGEGVERDRKQSLDWFHRAADNGNAVGQFVYGQYLLDERKVPLAMEYLLKAANQDHPKAFSILQRFIPHCVTSGKEKALEKLSHLASQGNSAAQYFSAVASQEKGEVAQAMNWFHEAAMSGSLVAQFELYLAYEQGEGVKTDPQRAMFWLREAAYGGFIEAQYELGRQYLEGEMGPENNQEAIGWLKKAAEKGESRAQNILGVCYGKGLGVEQDDSQAMKWFQKAAQKGNAVASYHCGVGFLQGKGVAKDTDQALHYFMSAAEAGHWPGLSAYVRTFLQNTEEESTTLLQSIVVAAEVGNPRFQYVLAKLYETGNGVPQDPKEALKWLTASAEYGVALAENELGILYEKGEDLPFDLSKAFRLYESAAKKGFVEARLNLARCYLYGGGTPKNDVEAYAWYWLALQEGYQEDPEILGIMSTLEERLSPQEKQEAQSRIRQISGS